MLFLLDSSDLHKNSPHATVHGLQTEIVSFRSSFDVKNHGPGKRTTLALEILTAMNFLPGMIPSAIASLTGSFDTPSCELSTHM